MARWIDEIEGHDETWKDLLALQQEDRLPHGLAFVGPSGIGKKRVAFALAQAGVCTEKNAPCGECGPCVRVKALQTESLKVIAPSGAVLKLEQAQEILNFLSLRSLSRRRFVVIDDAHQMNPSFANALLKILEEPPANTHFIFVLPALSQLLPTVRSRLQAVRFFPLSDKIIAEKSGSEEWMVRAAQGSFAQLEEWSNTDIAELKQKAIAALTDFRREGFEALAPEIKERASAEIVSRLFQQFFRDALHAQQGWEGVIHADCKPALQRWANHSKEQILEIWRQAFLLQQDIQANLDRALAFEVFFQRGREILRGA